MATRIDIAGSRAALEKLAADILVACQDGKDVQIEVEARNNRGMTLCDLAFTNDDMEPEINPELPEGVILVDVT